MPSDVTLRLSIGKVNATPVPRIVMESLTETSVHVSTGSPSGFDLKFATSVTSPLLTRLLPEGYFDPPSRVILSAVMRGVEHVLMDGVITHHEMSPSSEAGKSTLSIKGEDLSRMLDLIDLTGFPFPAMPAEARIALMIAKYAPLYKIVPIVMPSVMLDVSNPLESTPSQHGTDLAYIKYLADLVGYTFYIHPGPTEGFNIAYWGPLLRAPIPFLRKPAPFTINWDHRSNVESLSFSFDGFSATQWYVLIQDSVLHLTIPIPVPNVNPISPKLAKNQPTPLKVKGMTGMAKYSPIQAAGIALGRAAAEANKVVKGQGTLDVLRYGAILDARTIVEVRGAGITYDGDYFIDSVTHTIKPGSYKQSFTLSRNSLIAANARTAAGPGPLGQPLAALAPPQPPLPPGPQSGAALPTPLSPVPASGQPPSAGRVADLPASPT